MIYARSGLASKYGITLANSVGVVDSDYRGEIKVALINLSDKDFIIEPCMRIAQLVVTPVEFAESEEKTELDETKRGDGGFGSTGK
jgi:dUTP pyrophosphatase